jgi:nitrate/nitrite transport system permease protein
VKGNVVRIPTQGSRPASNEPATAAIPAQKPASPRSSGAVRPAGRDKWAAILRATALPALTFVIVIAVWSVIHSNLVKDIPSPSAAWHEAMRIFAHPFYDNGPNDKGIGWQVLYSLGRVLAGFGLAVAVGVPVGFLMGMSPTCRLAWQPLIQILRPVSPLAWLPIGLLLFRAVDPSAIFVIFITCIWPTLINTAAGVQAVPKDYLNVAAVLRLGKWEIARRILLPATLPYIMTGMRLSLGIAWMVIVAAEMLTGGTGIGFYIWDEWNNLNVASIIVCIVLIGLVGIVLEGAMSAVQRRFDYNLR